MNGQFIYKRKLKLFYAISEIQELILNKFNELDDYYIIDSMHLEIVKLSKSGRCKICKEDYESSLDKGFCASQNMYFYGDKLHTVCSINGIFKSIDTSKAYVYDIHYIKEQLNNCVIIGD